MANVKGRTTRQPGQASKLLQGAVNVDIHTRALRGAAARNVSLARYLEIIVEADSLADAYEEAQPDQLAFEHAKAS